MDDPSHVGTKPGSHRSSLKRNLLKSHLLVAAVGGLILLVAVATNLWLSRSVYRLAAKSAPIAQAALQAESGLQGASASLRGWMAWGNGSFKTERRKIWEGKIWPNLKKLNTLLVQNADGTRSDRSKSLNELFRGLEDWQWHIEDVAQTPGNEPARVALRKNVDPVADNIFSIISAVTKIQKTDDGSFSKKKFIKAFAVFQAAFSHCQLNVINFVHTGEEIYSNYYEENKSKARSALVSILADISDVSSPQHQQVVLLRKEFRAYADLADRAVGLRRSDNWNVTLRWFSQETAPATNEILKRMGKVVSYQTLRIKSDAKNLAQVSIFLPWISLSLLVLMILLPARVAAKGAAKILDPILELSEASRKFAAGKLPDDIVIKRDDELGELAESINEMRRAFAKSGENQSKINDNLARQNFIKSQLAEFSDSTSGEQDVASLGVKALSFLVKPMNAQMAAFYIVDGDRLRMVSSYAYSPRKSLSNEYKFGENIVGQAAIEKKTIEISRPPKNYLNVESGLVKALPKYIRATPVSFGNDVLGVVEMAAFKEFDKNQKDFFDQACQNFGVVLNSARARAKMKALLEDAQQQSEMLQVQQKKLKLANASLENQTLLLKESEINLQEQGEELHSQSQEMLAQSEELRVMNDELREKQYAMQEQKEEVEASKNLAEAKAKELYLASKYKSEFLANMSHELRTPLNSLLLLSKSLANNKQGNLTEEQVEDARVIYDGGQGLLTLIGDIMDLSKVEAGKLEVNLETVAISTLAHNVRKLFDPVAKTRGLSFVIDAEGFESKTIKSDGHRVTQILKNLLSNAMKFTENGSVTLKIFWPQSDIKFMRKDLHPGRVLGFSVIDTGMGILVENQRAIFEAFHQADGSTSRKYGGTGLGLSISRELTRLLGGEIHLNSVPGEGSCFTLYLPTTLHAKMPSAKEAADPGSGEMENIIKTPAVGVPPGKKSQSIGQFISDDRKDVHEGCQSILVIEDDAAMASTLRDHVRGNNYKCLVAGTGRSGIALALEYFPTGILLDIGLPDIDGYQVLEQLKYNLKTRHIPVQILSGREENDKSMSHRAVGFLKKPVDEASIDSVLKRIFEVSSSETCRILVIEDDPDNQRAITSLLENKSIKIKCVDLGKDACKEILTYQYDCVILDPGLPDISGLEVLEYVNKNKKQDLPPIIIYTGGDISSEDQELFDQYSASVILKGAVSSERLLDDVSLFIHSVGTKYTDEQNKAIRMLHDQDAVLVDRKVLLVDDDMRNCYALSKQLMDVGLIVEMAKNGKEAVDILEKETDFELVLMDIMMPVMDGYEAASLIRKMRHYKNVPIIALTAKAMPKDREKCFEAGASEYVMKPIDLEKLLSILRIWLFKNTV